MPGSVRTASEVPWGDSAKFHSWLSAPKAGMGNGVSLVRKLPDALAGLIRSRKNFVAGAQPGPVGAHPARRAPSTKVRPSPAAVTPSKVPYGRGGVKVASTAPVAVARTTARVLGWQQPPLPVMVSAT